MENCNVKTFLKLFLLASLIAITGCQKDQPANGKPKEILLYCGAGIRPPVAEICDEFTKQTGIKIAVDYSGSEVLLSKIKLAQKGDFYMPGDKYYVDQAEENGFILEQKQVSYFIPTILVKKGNPKNINSLEDLLQNGLRLGLGDSKACAIGRKTKKILEKNNIAWQDIEKNVKFLSKTVNELGIQIQAGSLDAVIVWKAVAEYYTKYGDVIAITPEKNIISTISIGLLGFTENKDSAHEFMQFITSERAKQIFVKYNYTINRPE